MLATSQYWLPSYQGIAFTDTDVYWLSSSDVTDPSAQKYRVQKTSTATPGTPVSLVSNLAIVDQIAAGLQRVYFVGTQQGRVLYGVNFDGSNLSTELQNVYGVQFGNNRIYYASNYNGAAYLKWKDVLTSAEGQVYAVSGAAWNGQAVGSSFGVQGSWTKFVEQTPDAYRILDQASNPLQQGSGWATRLRANDNDLLWIEVPTTQGQDSVAKYASGTGQPVAMTQAPTVIDIAYACPTAYVSFALGQQASYQNGIDVVDATNNAKTTLLLNAQARSLEINGGYLYFFLGDRLVRIKLPL